MKADSEIITIQSTDKDVEIHQIEVVPTEEYALKQLPPYEKEVGDEEIQHADGSLPGSSIMSIICMLFLFTGSQLPMFLIASVAQRIYTDIGGEKIYAWMILGHVMASASIFPTVGSLADLLGRRYLALTGGLFQVISMIICGTAQTMEVLIGGMVLSGVGAGINELMAMSVTAELVPTRKRGKYIGGLVFTMLPFMPSVFYSQAIASKSIGAWRWLCVWAGIWAGLAFIFTFIFYRPLPRPNSFGLTRKQVLGRIDFVGGILSIGGILLFLMGLLSGASQYPWSSPHVVAPVIVGGIIFILFPIWEGYGAKYPMYPPRLYSISRTMTLLLIITFISGVNFLAIMAFWPLESYALYDHSVIGNGLRSLPIGMGLIIGAILVLFMLSYFRGHNRTLIVVSACLMTAGSAGLAAVGPDNIGLAYIMLTMAGVGVGGIVIPCSIISTIICPDDLISTVAALTMSIRVVGGAVGYSVYWNVFYSLAPDIVLNAVSKSCISLGITNPAVIGEISGYLLNTETDQILPLVGNNSTTQAILIRVSQYALAEGYQKVYYVSIPFGVITIISAFFMEDITKYLDNHIAMPYR